MKIILIGSDRSADIRKAGQYLLNKYLPGFCPIYLSYNGILEGWAGYIASFLTFLTDDKIILGLDDFLVEEPINMAVYNKALEEVQGDVVCVKLCKSTPEEHESYPVTAQFCIWDREYLISLLRQVTTPWKFEIEGSALFDKTVLLRTCIQYDCNSSMSRKWHGVNLGNLKEEDVYYLRSNRLI